MRKFHGGMIWQAWGAPIARVFMLLTSFGLFLSAAHGEVYVVDFNNNICTNRYDCGDDHDAQPGDGVAERILGGGQTTFRSAIEESNELEGHDYIMLPSFEFFLRVDLPPLTDPAGVTIMSMQDEQYILDGTAFAQRLREYRDLLEEKFDDIDLDDSDTLTFGETGNLLLRDVRNIIHSQDGMSQADFDYMDANSNGILTHTELEEFRGAGSGITIASPNNNILDVTIVNFYGRGIIVDGEDADDNVIQGCNIGVWGTDAQDRSNARRVSEDAFEDADLDKNNLLSLIEAQRAIPGLTQAAFNRLDEDRSGSLTLAEVNGIAALVDTELAIFIQDQFEQLDLDNSNSVSFEELTAELPDIPQSQFSRMDRNNSGVLTFDELDTVIADGDIFGVTGTLNRNRQHGIVVSGGADNTIIGGAGEGEGNTIAGNGSNDLFEILDVDDNVVGYSALDFGHGILVSGAGTTNTKIYGNFVGTNVNGRDPVGNGYSGIVVENGATDTSIGGVLPGEGNVIDHNGAAIACPTNCANGSPSYYGRGVMISGGTATNNVVLGNAISSNATYGVYLLSADGVQIGGELEGAGNTITKHFASNLGGGNIAVFGGTNITIADNISTNSTNGLILEGGANIFVGTPGFGNVFSSCTVGTSISSSTNVFYYSNLVGPDETGTLARANSYSGIYIRGGLSNVRIGGAGAGEGNVISGNINDGIVIYDIDAGAGATPDLFIQGNRIGTNAAGTAALPNKVMGILVGPDTRKILIGGTGAGEGNVISGNSRDGIRVARRLDTNETPDNISIFGNVIGLNAAMTAPIPNALSGVTLLQVDEDVRLGGLNAGEANVIAGNTEHGVRVKGGVPTDITTFSTIRGNSIYGNGMRGIGLEEGGNGDIEKPVILGVSPLNGTAPADSIVDVYADTADEGRYYLGAAVADGAGVFTLMVPLENVQANNLTATATNATTGSTSEFSDPLTLVPPSIATPPNGLAVVEGEPFGLSVSATGTSPITYQWQFLLDGDSEYLDVPDVAPFSGAQTNTLLSAGARISDQAKYRCVATNLLGDIESASATVTVVPLSTDFVAVSPTATDNAPLDGTDGDTQSMAHLTADPGEDGVISLREAITAANNHAGADTITFTTAGTVMLAAELPALEDATGGTTIDGAGEIVLDGDDLSGSESGLLITSAANVLKGLSVVNMPANGIDISGADATSNVITACFLGVDGANGANGVEIRDGASDNTVGGVMAGEGNIISGNTESGVALAGENTTGNLVLGNFIGTDATGDVSEANGTHGVLIEDMASENEVGGDEAGEGNTIAFNTGSGVYIVDAGTTGNTVSGNDILDNTINGVAVLDGATDTFIGGLTENTGNRIEGNGVGVLFDGAATLGNTIRGNSITANVGDGIVLTNGANEAIASPEIAAIGSVIGTAPANSTVEIFVDSSDEGDQLIATIVVGGDGNFESSVDVEPFFGSNITATATDGAGNTSAFSAPFVLDFTPPVLSLIGAMEIVVECGSGTYVDAGATALDNVDGDITSEIVVTIMQGATVIAEIDGTATGTYTITYEVSDAVGLAADPITRTVTVADSTAPTITLTGASSTIVECSTEYVDAGATATDGCDGDLAVVVNNLVDTSQPGVYTVTYSTTDGSGNAAVNVVRTVTVRDTSVPTLTLLGDAMLTLECSTELVYEDAGATITDSCDAEPTLAVTNPVNPGKVGTYTIRYNGTDASGNAANQIIRIVEVVDTTAPVITLNGNAEVDVTCGSVYGEEDATAEDDCGGTLAVTISGSVDTGNPGEYILTYTAVDVEGNAATPVTRTVRVADSGLPTIQLIGSASVSVACNSVYEELGATASDTCSNDISDSLVISGSVDTESAGDYVINYDVTDSLGNVATRVSRTVTVTACPEPCDIQCENDPGDKIDADGDGLSACVEACLGTSDNEIDSDADGVPDGVEATTGTDPANADSDLDLDGDGLSALEEFVFSSDPLNADSPAQSFFIASNGANSVNGGSAGTPWNSISFALSQVTPTANSPVRLIVGPGNYAEDVELKSWVTLVGATGSLPRIEGTVFGANNSTLDNVEIAAFSSDDVMLVMDNVKMNVLNVVFRGSAARPAAGALVDGAASAASVFDGCLFDSLSVGVDVGGALPMIRRCTFMNTSIAGVFVRSTASITGGVSLGRVNDAGTGSNLFAGIDEGRAIINELVSLLTAEQNEWGTTDLVAIGDTLVSGLVDFDPVLASGAASDTASLYITVWTATSQARISTASVTVSGAGTNTTVTSNSNGVYALPVLRSGTYSITVAALGFEDKSTTVTLTAEQLGSKTVALTGLVEKGGGPSCAPGVSGTGLWSDLLLAVLLLVGLTCGREIVGKLGKIARH